MKEMGLRAQWVRPWIATTVDSDISRELHNILDEQFNPDRPNAVWCTDITYVYRLPIILRQSESPLQLKRALHIAS